MRVAIYSDFPYRRHDGRLYAGQAFVLFLAGLAELVERLVLVGRLDPLDAPWHFPVAEGIEYKPLPYYAQASEPLSAFATMARSVPAFWRAVDDVDTVWLFGPHPLVILFALIAFARRRSVVLGVRQDYIPYVRSRHPGRRGLLFGALLIDHAFRLIARRCSVVAVGSAQAERYAHARRLLPLSVALISEGDIIPNGSAPACGGREEQMVLSVGRLDSEKNPLLLADVLADLCSDGGDWRLTVCGEGPLEDELCERLRALGVVDRAQLRGFVPAGERLHEIYRKSDLFLHTSHTEGVPQVLFEAFAAGLPVVATDVGGVAETAGDAALLIAPDDHQAAAAALRRLARDASLRAHLVDAGLHIARSHTRERQCRLVADFLCSDGRRRDASR